MISLENETDQRLLAMLNETEEFIQPLIAYFIEKNLETKIESAFPNIAIYNFQARKDFVIKLILKECSRRWKKLIATGVIEYANQ